MSYKTANGGIAEAKRLVLLPFNEHSAVAVYSYLATDPDFVNHAKMEPEMAFPREGKTLKKMQISFNGTLFISYLPGEDIPHWSIEYAKKHPHVEGITTTDFWLDKLYSDEWRDIRKDAGFEGEEAIDPRELIKTLIKDGEYSFRINGYRVHWKVLEANYPKDVAKFVVLGPQESNLEEYRKLSKLEHITEKRLANFGRRSVQLVFPEQEINTQLVTRSSEKWARFNLNQGDPIVVTDLAQSYKSAKEAGLKVFENFGIQPLIKSTMTNGTG